MCLEVSGFTTWSEHTNLGVTIVWHVDAIERRYSVKCDIRQKIDLEHYFDREKHSPA
jgi:hypothetical protein